SFPPTDLENLSGHSAWAVFLSIYLCASGVGCDFFQAGFCQRQGFVDRRTNFDFHFSSPLADPIEVRTRSGRSGKSLNRIPPNAFATAFPIAGSTGPSPASPTPLAPNGPSGCGVSTNTDRNSLG